MYVKSFHASKTDRLKSGNITTNVDLAACLLAPASLDPTT